MDQVKELLKKITALKKGLTPHTIAIDFCAHALQPIKSRVSPAFRYIGSGGPSREIRRPVTPEEVYIRVHTFFQGHVTNKGCPKSYYMYNPAPEEWSLLYVSEAPLPEHPKSVDPARKRLEVGDPAIIKETMSQRTEGEPTEEEAPSLSFDMSSGEEEETTETRSQRTAIRKKSASAIGEDAGPTTRQRQVAFKRPGRQVGNKILPAARDDQGMPTDETISQPEEAPSSPEETLAERTQRLKRSGSPGRKKMPAKKSKVHSKSRGGPGGKRGSRTRTLTSPSRMPPHRAESPEVACTNCLEASCRRALGKFCAEDRRTHRAKPNNQSNIRRRRRANANWRSTWRHRRVGAEYHNTSRPEYRSREQDHSRATSFADDDQETIPAAADCNIIPGRSAGNSNSRATFFNGAEAAKARVLTLLQDLEKAQAQVRQLQQEKKFDDKVLQKELQELTKKITFLEKDNSKAEKAIKVLTSERDQAQLEAESYKKGLQRERSTLKDTQKDRDLAYNLLAAAEKSIKKLEANGEFLKKSMGEIRDMA